METSLPNLQSLYNSLPQVLIDPVSTFKYIYISAYLKPSKGVYNALTDSLVFIRGSKAHSYHQDIYEEFLREFKRLGAQLEEKGLLKLKFEVYGGGWMEWSSDGKKLHIFGESQKYGPMNHEKTREVIIKNRKDLKSEDITYKNSFF